MTTFPTPNFCVFDFSNDPFNWQVVAEANVDPPIFQFFTYNLKTMKNFENLKVLSLLEFEYL